MQDTTESEHRAQGAAVPPSVAGRGRFRRLLLAVLAIAVVGALAFWVRRKDHASHSAGMPSASASAGGRIVPVVVTTAQRRDVPVYLDGLGNAVPLATVAVRSQVDGRLEAVLFKEGQAVKKGEVLAQIDARPFLIALHQAEAASMRDRATAANALRNLERYKTLVEQRLIPQQQVDDQQMTYDQAQATVLADQAQIENARLQLDYARIKAPVDGVTGVRLIDPGNLVRATDATGIVVVTQLDPMAVVFTLPEENLARISAELAKGPLNVEAYSRDQAKRVGVGKLAVVDNQVNQATATLKLKAIFPNPDKSLWPNAFVKTRLLLSVAKGALVVPASAVQRGPKGTFVYVVERDETASMRPITIETVEDESAIVTRGLAEGDRVVVEGQNQLRPGAKVARRVGPSPSASGGARR